MAGGIRGDVYSTVPTAALYATVIVLGGLKVTADVVVPLVNVQLALTPVGKSASRNMTVSRLLARR